MTFRTVAVLTSVVTLVLGAGYLFAGTPMIGRLQVEPTESVLLFGRRMGALYLGLSVAFFLARSAPVSVARTALCTGTAAACSLLAMLGIYEFLAGRAGPGMLASVLIESLLALAYVRILIGGRKIRIGD